VIGETGLEDVLKGFFSAESGSPVLLTILLAWVITAVLHLVIGSISVAAITGVVGGAVRDVLCGETPLILRREIYATAAVAGATTYVALNAWAGQDAITITASMAVTLILRLSAVWADLNLPTESPKE
jgi:uncharacterized membrane protein YeiH